LASKLFHIDAIPWADAILSSPGFHNGIHTVSFTLYDRARLAVMRLLSDTTDGRMKSTQN
jgi:hypothetical protein